MAAKDFLRFIDDVNREAVRTIREGLQRGKLHPSLLHIDWRNPHAKEIIDVYREAVLRWWEEKEKRKPAAPPDAVSAYSRAYYAIDKLAHKADEGDFSDEDYHRALLYLSHYIFALVRGEKKYDANSVVKSLRALRRRAERAGLSEYAELADALAHAINKGKRTDGSIDFSVAAAYYGTYLPYIIVGATSSPWLPFFAGNIYNIMVAEGKGKLPPRKARKSIDAIFKERFIKALVEKLAKQRAGDIDITRIPTRIDDLGGHQIVCSPEEATEIITAFLLTWKAAPPHHFIPGLLLYGPRGVGKTSIVKAAAEALGLDVLSVSATALRPEMMFALTKSTPSGVGDLPILNSCFREFVEAAGLSLTDILQGEKEVIRSRLLNHIPEELRGNYESVINTFVDIVTKDIPMLLAIYEGSQKQNEVELVQDMDAQREIVSIVKDKDRSTLAGTTYTDLVAVNNAFFHTTNEKLRDAIFKLTEVLDRLRTVGEEILHYTPIGEFSRRAGEEFVLFLDEVGYNPELLLVFLTFMTGSLLGVTKFKKVFVIAASNVSTEGAMPLHLPAQSRFVVLYVRPAEQSLVNYMKADAIITNAKNTVVATNSLLSKLKEKGVVEDTEDGELKVNSEKLGEIAAQLESRETGAGRAFSNLVGTIVNLYNARLFVVPAGADDIGNIRKIDTVWQSLEEHWDSVEKHGKAIGEVLYGAPNLRDIATLGAIVKPVGNIRKKAQDEIAERLIQNTPLLYAAQQLLPRIMRNDADWESLNAAISTVGTALYSEPEDLFPNTIKLVIRYVTAGAIGGMWDIAPTNRTLTALFQLLPYLVVFLSLRRVEGKFVLPSFDDIVRELKENIFTQVEGRWVVDIAKESVRKSLAAYLLRILAGAGGFDFATTFLNELSNAIERQDIRPVVEQVWDENVRVTLPSLLGERGVEERPTVVGWQPFIRRIKEAVESAVTGGAVLRSMLDKVVEIFGSSGGVGVKMKKARRGKEAQAPAAGTQPNVDQKVEAFLSGVREDALSDVGEEVLDELAKRWGNLPIEETLIRLLFAFPVNGILQEELTRQGITHFTIAEIVKALIKKAVERVEELSGNDDEQVRFATAFTNFLLALSTHCRDVLSQDLLQEFFQRWLLPLLRIGFNQLVEREGIRNLPTEKEAEWVITSLAPLSPSFNHIIQNKEIKTVVEGILRAWMGFTSTIFATMGEPTEGIKSVFEDAEQGRSAPKLLTFTLSLLWHASLGSVVPAWSKVLASVTAAGEELGNTLYTIGLRSSAESVLKRITGILDTLLREGAGTSLGQMKGVPNVVAHFVRNIVSGHIKDDEELNKVIEEVRIYFENAGLMRDFASTLMSAGFRSASDVIGAWALIGLLENIQRKLGKVPSIEELRAVLRNISEAIVSKIQGEPWRKVREMLSMWFGEQAQLSGQRLLQLLPDVVRAFNRIRAELPKEAMEMAVGSMRDIAEQAVLQLKEKMEDGQPPAAGAEEQPTLPFEEEVKQLLKSILLRKLGGC